MFLRVKGLSYCFVQKRLQCMFPQTVLCLYICNFVSLPVLFFASLFRLSTITTPAVELVTWLVCFIIYITTYLLWANFRREYACLWTPFTLWTSSLILCICSMLAVHNGPHTFVMWDADTNFLHSDLIVGISVYPKLHPLALKGTSGKAPQALELGTE